MQLKVIKKKQSQRNNARIINYQVKMLRNKLIIKIKKCVKAFFFQFKIIFNFKFYLFKEKKIQICFEKKKSQKFNANYCKKLRKVCITMCEQTEPLKYNTEFCKR